MSLTNDITDLSSTSSLINNDLFVVSQQDRYISKKYNTQAIHNDKLFDVLFEKIMERAGLSSAAYVDSRVFSPKDHLHDNLYNKLQLTFTYDYRDTSQEMISVGNMFYDGTLSAVCIPLSAIKTIFEIPFTISEPNIGDLKFVGNKNITFGNSNIDYTNENFDGWLFPDGSSFQLTDFILSDDLNKKYGNGDNLTFTLPIINDFLALDGHISNNSGISHKDQFVALPKHSHTLKPVITGEINLTSHVQVTKYVGDGYVHTGNSEFLKKAPWESGFNWNAKINTYDYIYDDAKTPGGINKQIATADKEIADQRIKIANQEARKLKYPNNTWVQQDADRQIAAAKDKIKEEENKIIYLNNAKSNFFKHITYKFSAFGTNITQQINLGTNITINSVGDNNIIYPKHIQIPVMIYVGQRKRSIKE